MCLESSETAWAGFVEILVVAWNKVISCFGFHTHLFCFCMSFLYFIFDVAILKSIALNDRRGPPKTTMGEPLYVSKIGHSTGNDMIHTSRTPKTLVVTAVKPRGDLPGKAILFFTDLIYIYIHWIVSKTLCTNFFKNCSL